MARLQQRPRVEHTQIFRLGAEQGMMVGQAPTSQTATPPQAGSSGTYLVGPAKDGEGEEARRKPGVQYILI